MSALLLAAWISAPVGEPPARIVLEPNAGTRVTVEDPDGNPVAQVELDPHEPTIVYAPEGEYVVRGEGPPRTVRATREQPTAAPKPSPDAAPQPSATLPAAPPHAVPPPRREPAWRAPLMSAFVPGLGHAWAGKPGWGVGILGTTAAAVTGAVVLGLQHDRTDGATPSDAASGPGYARLGGFAALTSIAGALYVGQIFDAHRVERGERLEPKPGRVQVRFDRLTAVSMSAGRPRAALYDDLSLAALVRVTPRVQVGPSDMSVKLGPEQTVLQLGARGMFEAWGPTASHPYRRGSISVGGGLLGQHTARRRLSQPLDPEVERAERTERAWGAVPYVLADARLFVAPRWTVGALGRFGVPLTPRRYAAGRALPAFAPTVEFGVSLGVNL